TRRGPALLRGRGGRLRRATRRRLVVGKKVPPLHGHRRRIGQVALVQLIHEPLVRAEVRAGHASLGLGTGMLGRVLGGIRGRPRQLRRHGGHRPLPTCDRWSPAPSGPVLGYLPATSPAAARVSYRGPGRDTAIRTGEVLRRANKPIPGTVPLPRARPALLTTHPPCLHGGTEVAPSARIR